MVKKFDLNVEKVLENWVVSDGIREVIANALDEKNLSKTKEINIFEDKAGWHITDSGRGLSYKHLTQKENQEKLSNPNLVIGKFGVGLKDALATFDRHDVDVEISSKYGTITIEKSQKHGFDDILTLHALINEPKDKNFIGTEFLLKGCSKEDVEMAKANFLKFSNEKLLEKTKFGEVYEKQGNEATIYITGLKVATEENFLFSYNVTNITKQLRKALNRERSNVGRTAYVARVKDILLSCEKEAVAKIIAEDFKGFDQGTIHDELNWIDVSVHACKLLNQQRKVVFATSLDLTESQNAIDDSKRDGYETITVPFSVKEKITDLNDYKGNPMRTVSEYIREYNESFEFKFVDEEKLTSKEKEIFSKKDELFELFGGKPRIVEKVLISETMRKDLSGYEVSGLWNLNERTIIIKREDLKKIEKFAGTLLHEAAHALTGKPDISREFELELTRILGLVSSKNFA